jgi:hypothetical protein
MSEKTVSKSVSFGLQNFYALDVFEGSSVTGDDNIYIVSMDSKGLILIACWNSDYTQGRYIVKAGDYDSIVAARGNYTYVLPNQLKEIQSSSIR